MDTKTSTSTSPLNLLKDPSLLKTDALINGEWLAGGARFDVNDPATGLKLASVGNLSASDATKAIASAHAALPAWRGKTGKERHAILLKWFQLIMANQDDIGRMLTSEQGKPFPEAKGKSPTAPALSSGLPKRPSASTARRCRSLTTTAA